MDEYLGEMDDEVQHTDVYCEENELMDKHIKANEKAIARVRIKSLFQTLIRWYYLLIVVFFQ